MRETKILHVAGCVLIPALIAASGRLAMSSGACAEGDNRRIIDQGVGVRYGASALRRPMSGYAMVQEEKRSRLEGGDVDTSAAGPLCGVVKGHGIQN